MRYAFIYVTLSIISSVYLMALYSFYIYCFFFFVIDTFLPTFPTIVINPILYGVKRERRKTKKKMLGIRVFGLGTLVQIISNVLLSSTMKKNTI